MASGLKKKKDCTSVFPVICVLWRNMTNGKWLNVKKEHKQGEHTFIILDDSNFYFLF